jgi:23S rRNA pseudouridine2604 synthase
MRPKLGEDHAQMRLNKRMAQMGLASRREADEWIEQGWVRVNGCVAQMGMKVSDQDHIEVQRQATQKQEQKVTVLLHKPMGYVSGQAEDGHVPAIKLIEPVNHWALDRSPIRYTGSHLKSLVPAGRLDIDSVGLLVLTQDGRVAKQLIGEGSELEKEYLVRVEIDSRQVQGEGARPAHVVTNDETPYRGEMSKSPQRLFAPERLELLRHGLSLDGQKLKPAQVEWQNPDQLRFVLTEGKKRQIRRMCELVGLKVVGLKRIRMGRVLLGALPAGQWRYLGKDEHF